MKAFINLKRRSRRGFTLIELLIVIAIILILIAIALPNFLEARTRALVTKIKAEQKSLYTALESYWQIFKKYPPTYHQRCDPAGIYKETANIVNITVRWGLRPLTTPVAFLKPLPYASFTTKGSRGGGDYIAKPDAGGCYEAAWFPNRRDLGWAPSRAWNLRDSGPDQWFDNDYPRLYSPTNGTLSYGDIIIYGP